jgi:hypothetical protein
MISEEKLWAEGMAQDEFEREFQRRNPLCDVIPDLKKWLHTENPKHSGIDKFNLEDMEIDDIPRKEEVKDLSRHCKGCGRVFPPITVRGKEREATLAYFNHTKNCKNLLEVRT